MDRIILFFLGSVLLLSGCKNSKQPEGYNSVNIIEYVNIYDENNRILTAQGSEYDYLYFGDNKKIKGSWQRQIILQRHIVMIMILTAIP